MLVRQAIDDLRRDAALRSEVTRWSPRWPRSCHVADLSNPRDEGVRRAVQAIKRRLRDALPTNRW